jgi:uncharacterized protein
MFKRNILKKIELFLETNDILLFYWARQVWKTSIMKILQNDYITRKSYFFDLENIEYLDLLNKNPNIFIEYLKSYHSRDENEKIVVFVDEIQYLNNPTNFLKYIYDNYNNIKLIISGSSTLEIRWKLNDSLVWRMIKFDIYPLSFQEFLIFKNKGNLANLVEKKIDLDIINNELQFFYEEYMTFGGYPKIVLANEKEIKKEYLKQIYNTYIQKDIKDIWKIKELEKFNKLIKLLANQSWNLVNLSEISNTVWINIKTLNEWIFLLENTFVIKLITPFSGNLRWELTKMPKIFFIDNWIRNFCDNNFDLIWNSFENSFFNYINNSYKASKINFYRTQDKKEIDFVLDEVPYELKLNYNWKNSTALNYFFEKYDKKGNIVTINKSDNSQYNILYPREI